ncbi:hypothetical protein OSB04_019706 [Centaurea solstitialis]|uniref:Retroviral polymerase SH3-like domain-containing protein n=1 Tax=Centaurea solstitialis TaxID=347529 RepID=A0AA38TAD1_9ASTR|nr:hypothetical protein OSB04_019706 [Centaurea solstitialis]
MTACYMINRMPSSILQNQTPFLVLFPTQKPYHLSLHPIGFVCFVHCLESGRGKLAPKAVKCVFLGYSRLQKSPYSLIQQTMIFPPLKENVNAPLPIPIPFIITSTTIGCLSFFLHVLPVLHRFLFLRLSMKLYHIQGGTGQWSMR